MSVIAIEKLVTDADRKSARTRWRTAWKEPYVARRTQSRWREAHDEAPLAPTLGTEGVWERILRARGMVKREDGSKLYITCFNESQHTSASDSGTVLYRPAEGDLYGHIHCSHAHCAELDFRTLVTENEWQVACDYVKAFLVSVNTDSPIVCTQVSDEDNDMKLWHELIRDAKGGSDASGIAANVSAILHRHSFWRGKLAYDTFRHVQVWDSVPVELQAQHKRDNGVLSTDYTYMQGWLLKGDRWVDRGVITANIDAIKAGVADACSRNPIDTLERHVLSVDGKWDGAPRLDTWLTEYLGCEATPLTRAMGARWLIAMTARAMSPGCVADMMPVLQGDQGVGKGHCLKILFGNEFVVTTGTYKVGSKDFEQRIADSWCAHDDELVSTEKAGLQVTKSWLSDTWAKFRKAYAPDFITVDRRFLVVGSCNPDKFLEDTENRRFWPIRMKQLREDELYRDRDKLMGEALAYFRTKTEYRIRPQDAVWAELGASHEQVKHEDLFQQKLAALLRMPPANGGLEAPFQMFQVFDRLGFRPDQHGDKSLQRRIGESLRALGYRSRQEREGKSRPWVWRPHSLPSTELHYLQADLTPEGQN